MPKELKDFPHYEDTNGIIYQGDCLEIMPLLKDKSIDLVLTDPPYGIDVSYKNCVTTRNDNRSNEIIAWDNKIPNKKCFTEIIRVSKEQIIWGANYFNCFGKKGGAIVWDKLQPLEDSSQCEIASYSRLKKVFKYVQRWTNFVNTKTSNHPTEKPLKLMIWLINKFTNKTDIIFDPFAGSGTTLVAAKELGRRFIGIEIEPKYVEICNRRLQQEYFDLKCT